MNPEEFGNKLSLRAETGRWSVKGGRLRALLHLHAVDEQGEIALQYLKSLVSAIQRQAERG